MELEFRNSFVAGSSARPDSGVSGGNKANQKSDGQSFESTLEAKKTEKNQETERSPFTDSNETEKTKEKGKTKTDDTKTKDTKNAEKVKPEEISKDVEVKETVEDVVDNAVTDKVKDELREAVEQTVKDEEAIAGTETPEDTQVEMTDGQSVQVMTEIAQVMGVTPQQVAETLDKLQMMPEDLQNPENLTKFTVEIKGVSEPAELLKLPEVPQMMRDVKELVAKAVEIAKAGNEQVGTQPASEQGTNNQFASLNITQVTVTQNQQKASQQVEAPEAQAAAQAQTAEAADAEVNGEESALPENLVNENGEQRVRVDANVNAQNQQGQGESNQRGEQPQQTKQTAGISSVSDSNTAETPTNIPVVLKQGEETVVEIDGKTVSRTLQRPQVPASDVLNQIVDKMKIDFKPESSEIKINLRPQDLGNLQVRIVTENGMVTAEIVAENSNVKELIEKNIEELKNSLLSQGVDVGELSVSVGQQEQGGNMNQFLQEQERTQGRMSKMLSRYNGEEMNIDEAINNNYADESLLSGASVDFTA